MSDHSASRRVDVLQEEAPELIAPPNVYEAVVKVKVSDPPERRARDIVEGIGYACALLLDEYGWTADRIEDALTEAADSARDQEEQRR